MTDVELERFGGQTNKQTTHRFPAALRRSWGNPPRLHHPVTLISTYVKDAPCWGKPAHPLHTSPTNTTTSSLPSLSFSFSSLVNSIPWTSPGDGASEVNHYQRLVIILLEEVRAGLPLGETDKWSGLRIRSSERIYVKEINIEGNHRSLSTVPCIL